MNDLKSTKNSDAQQFIGDDEFDQEDDINQENGGPAADFSGDDEDQEEEIMNVGNENNWQMMWVNSPP